MKKLSTVRSICAFLALVMLFQVFVACKSNNNREDGTTTTTTQKVTYPTGSDYEGERITLFGKEVAPVIYYDTGDHKQSIRAIKDLADDFKKVTGKKASLVNDFASLAGTSVAIIAGTLGESELIDGFAENGTIDVSAIKDQWEAYTIKVVKDIEPGIKSAVIIAGSDKRGTAYGAYTLSELIGVSPWYYWGDVEIEHKDEISLAVSSLEMTDMPDVKYRGIFLNDEELFTAWSKKFVSKNSPGAPGPDVYATVFELILRLKANTLWPAMHAGTTPFNEYKNDKTGVSLNAELADDYGVIMSASHCEMMLRNNEGEWESWAKANASKYNIKQVNGSWRSAYDYTVNAAAMNAYWEERVAANYRFENIYMIGLRGVHDSGINCSGLADKSYQGKASVVKKAVEAQLKILEKYEKKYEEETGEAIKFQTAYCVYKEAAEYFRYDLSLPSDCCLVYCDDNYGYVRSVPTEEDFSKYSSFGMYYHISYHGAPYSYLWVANAPLELIAEEMLKTYTSGMQDLWILNVGDIKPGEVKTEYFLDLAWDVDSHNENNTDEFYVRFLKQNFSMSDTESAELAGVLGEFYQIMHNYLPEHMGKRNLEYSPTAWGGETMIIVNKLQRINEKSLAVMKALSEGKRTAYYELFHYTIYSYLLMAEKYAYKSMNEICIDQGRYAAANIYADLSEAAYNAVLAEAKYYNEVNAKGKWSGILNPYGGVAKADTGAPAVTRVSATHASGGVGMVSEGQNALDLLYTLNFGSLADDTRYIDIFNRGTEKDSWSLSAPSWMIIRDAKGNILSGTRSAGVTLYSGEVEIEDRYYLSVDWSAFTDSGTKAAELILTDNYGASYKVPVNAVKSAADTGADVAAGHKGYYEENGLVSIEAEHYSKAVSQGSYSWVRLENMGRSGDSMKAVSNEGFGRKRITQGHSTTSPYMEYEIYFSTVGSYSGYITRLPILNESADGRTTCSVAYAFDGGKVNTVRGVVAADDNGSSAWGNMIMIQHEKLRISLTVEEAGWHTLRIYMGDANMIIDQIVLNHSTVELPYSRLCPPETFNTVAYTKADTSYLPETSFDMVNWVSFSQSYDFTIKSAHEGYLKVNASGGGSEKDGWEWIPGNDAQTYDRSTQSKTEITDQFFVAGNADGIFRIWTEPGATFGINIASGDPAGQVKASNMSVTCNGEAVLSGISTSTGVSHSYFIAVADKNGLIEMIFNGQWIVNSVEIHSYKKAASSGSGAFISGGDSSIAIEAESALENSEYAYHTSSTDANTHQWTEVAGTSGSARVFGPNTGAGYTSTTLSENKSAKMHYKVNFEHSGKYAVWMLVKCAGLDDDSILVGIDNSSLSTKNVIDNTGGYRWVQVATVTVSSSGVHTLNVVGREDGISIDRIILVPTDSTTVNYNDTQVRE